MAKAYWIATYRTVSDPAKLAKYAVLAGPAIIAGGGKFLARGEAAHVYEAGIKARTVLIEFPSVAAAKAAHDSPAYQAALDALDNGADRRSASSKARNKIYPATVSSIMVSMVKEPSSLMAK